MNILEEKLKNRILIIKYFHFKRRYYRHFKIYYVKLYVESESIKKKLEIRWESGQFLFLK